MYPQQHSQDVVSTNKDKASSLEASPQIAIIITEKMVYSILVNG